MWRRTVLARAADHTASAAGRRAVVVAPHPDDETLGCGAVIARKRAAGTDVTVVVVTDGRHSHRSATVSPDELAALRADEARAACTRLGVEPSRLHLLGLEEATAASRREEVARRLAEVLDDAQPDEVLTTCASDWHVDHQAVSAAARKAVASACPGARILEFPIWFWVDGPWGVPSGQRQQVWGYLGAPLRASRIPAVTVRSEEHLAVKRAALAEYRTQTTNLTGERDWAVMDDDLLSLFLGPVELFFPVEPGAGR